MIQRSGFVLAYPGVPAEWQVKPEDLPVMTIEAAREEAQSLGEAWRSNWLTFEVDGTLILDGSWTPSELRRLADLWDASHNEDGSER